MRLTAFTRIAAAGALAAVAAFAVIGGASADDNARVRVLHASPDAPAVDVYVDGNEAISDLAFNDITGYIALPAGSYDVQVFPASANGAGDPVIAATLTLDAGTDYTVAAVGRVAEIEPLVLVDNNAAPAAGKAHVRFVHASPNAPAVDIAAAGAGVVVANAPFKAASDYLPLDAGTYDLQVLAAGTSTVALDLPGITLDAGNVYTAFATGLLGESPALGAKLVVDSSHIQAPSTGSAGLVAEGGSSSSNVMFGLAGLALVVIAMGGTGLAWAYRRTR